MCFQYILKIENIYDESLKGFKIKNLVFLLTKIIKDKYNTAAE